MKCAIEADDLLLALRALRTRIDLDRYDVMMRPTQTLLTEPIHVIDQCILCAQPCMFGESRASLHLNPSMIDMSHLPRLPIGCHYMVLPKRECL